ncbi:MAG: 50S ribosomal protein L11 methyltransferase [Solirubrobacterales bacterium]
MIRLAVRCNPEDAELVLAELSSLAPNGFEEEQGRDYVEFAIYGGEGELPDLGRIGATAGDGTVEVSATEVPDDWADRWQDFHQPLLIGDRVWVRPSWAEPSDGAIDVVIEPGRAFGTGAHLTTRLCVELLVELAGAGAAKGPLTDLGTGSGVLAIVAAKLGWAPVTGFDHEPASLAAAEANGSANGVQLVLDRVNLRQELPGLAPVVVANLTSPLLRGIAAALEGRGLPRHLICSGLLQAEADEVGGRFADAGLVERERRHEGDWAAISLAPR